ncbi:MAG: tetratricopeptide repeat protein [Cyanobacteria bacterium HKST-UBA02]|nr:tetratricopeptide repeat protein [Cyanobacteria bacterium HKST-UBA02]
MTRFPKTGLLVAALLFGLGAAAPCQASSLDDGMAAYKAKDYTKAKPLLEKAVQENANNWQGHFYLGHTLYALGRLPDAKYQYQLCKRVSRDPAVIRHCDAGISRVDDVATKTRPTKAPPPVKAAESDDDDDKDSKSSSDSSIEEDTAKSASSKKRAEIMEKAKKECDKVKADAKKRLDEAKADASESFRYSDPEEMKKREEEINKETEKKCKDIMDKAERNAKTYR